MDGTTSKRYMLMAIFYQRRSSDSLKCSGYILILLIISFIANAGYGQDTLVNPLAEKYLVERAREDSILALQDTMTIKAQAVMSADSLDATVEYGSLDSNYLDNITRKVHLYGNAMCATRTFH